MRRLALFFLLCSVLWVAPVTFAQQNCNPDVPEELYRWDGQSRVNLLVLGMDRRPGARDNLNVRTDVIMIVSYDAQTNHIGLLDIPRDMHVGSIGCTYDTLLRINTLLVEGEKLAENYGPYFAMENIQYNFGMYIDAYIAFDFEAFIDFIDLIGGVTVDVPYAISDPTFPDMNYGYDPFYIGAGTQILDGRTALKYARTRHGDNDYERGLRQLQVVMGAFDALRQTGTKTQLVQNAPQLINDFRGHVYSNIAPEHLVFIGLSMLDLDADNIEMASINLDYSYEIDYNGLYVRVPDRSRLVPLLEETFGEDYWR